MTTSTVPQVKQQMVALYDAAVDVPVEYAQPADAHESVFLRGVPAGRHEPGALRGGGARVQRNEEYVVEVVIRIMRNDLGPGDAAEAEERAFQILADIEDVHAANPNLSLETIQWARAGDFAVDVQPLEKGWAVELVLQVNVRARLT